MSAGTGVEAFSLVRRSGHQPNLELDQERIVAEIVQVSRSASPNLRFAVIPVEVLQGLEPGECLALTWQRAQHYLGRVQRSWSARTHRRAELVERVGALADELRSIEAFELEGEARALVNASDEALILGALRLQRRLIRAARAGAAATAFSEIVELVLSELALAIPPTQLERLDVEAARLVARDFLIRCALPLVKLRASVVRGHSALPFDDLIQIGSVALIQAVDRFSPTFGAPFAAYAYPWIKQAMRRAEWQAEVISLPMRVRTALYKVRAARADPAWATASADQLASHLGLSPLLVQRALDESSVASLDGNAEGEGSLAATCAEDAPPLDEHVRVRERRTAVARALEQCATREQDILRRLYGIGCDDEPVAAVARRHGLTPQRIYQIRDAELRRLRHPRIAGELARYL